MEKINKVPFLLLTIINLAFSIHFCSIENIVIILTFFAGVGLNQYMLVTGVFNLMDEEGNQALAAVYIFSKLFVMIGAFWLIQDKLPQHLYIFIGNYIFQLIILGISIKKEALKKETT